LRYSFYFITSYDIDFKSSLSTTTSPVGVEWISSTNYSDHDISDTEFDIGTGENALYIGKRFSYQDVIYTLHKSTKNGLPTSTPSGYSTFNSGLPAEIDLVDGGWNYDEGFYAIIYTDTDLYSEIVTPLDLVTYLFALNGQSYGGGVTNPTTVATNTITRINSPTYAQTFSLGAATTTTVSIDYDYTISDLTYAYAYFELYNLSTNFSYVTPIQNILSSGSNNYSIQLTLPAGYYSWRPVLSNSSYTSKLYYQTGSMRTFTIAGNTVDWWGSYTVSTSTASTSWQVFDDIFSTSTFTLGTTTFNFDDLNVELLDFGEGVCGVNMSCFTPLCLQYSNICNRFPFAGAIDFYSVLQLWSGVVNSNYSVSSITYDLDLGVSSSTIVMVDFTEGSLTSRLAEKTHFWGSVLLWLVFAFWSFNFVGRFLS